MSHHPCNHLFHQVMASATDSTKPDITDKDPSVTETMSSMRECLQQAKLETVRASHSEAELEAISESTFEKLAPARLARVEQVVNLYHLDLRRGLGGKVF